MLGLTRFHPTHHLIHNRLSEIERKGGEKENNLRVFPQMTQAGFLFDEFDCYHIKEKDPLPRRKNDKKMEEIDVLYGFV